MSLTKSELNELNSMVGAELYNIRASILHEKHYSGDVYVLHKLEEREVVWKSIQEKLELQRSDAG